jgi:xanthine phosphoribosyltransferase
VTAHAAAVRDAVLRRGRVDGELLRVDDFLNHRVEIDIVDHAGSAIAAAFSATPVDVVVTAEASGIAPAISTARALGVPMVFAKKFLGPGGRDAFGREVTSPTKGVEYRVEIARRVLEPGLTALVVDDFLSRGRTAEAIGEILEEAGCSVAGLGFVVEKRWMAGRDRLEHRGWRVESVVEVVSLSDGIELA